MGSAGRPPITGARPELGYYISTDPFVIRKHASMLADAGVDVVIFDTPPILRSPSKNPTWRCAGNTAPCANRETGRPT